MITRTDPLSALADERSLYPATHEARPASALYRYYLPFEMQRYKKISGIKCS